MTLNEYKKELDKLIKAGAGGMTVIVAGDDEGNSYHDVFYAPGIVALTDIDDVYRGTAKEKAVCLN